jgi:hypothetical protein
LSSNPLLPLPPHRLPPLGPGKVGARRRVLAQWRGVDVAPLETARAVRGKSAGDILPKVLQGLRFDNRRAEAEIVKVWNQLLDPNIVAHAQPTGLHNGTLFVSVDNNVQHCEIVRYRRHEILALLHGAFSREFIKRISFRVG